MDENLIFDDCYDPDFSDFLSDVIVLNVYHWYDFDRSPSDSYFEEVLKCI